jgi:hypothetical protein
MAAAAQAKREREAARIPATAAEGRAEVFADNGNPAAWVVPSTRA